MLPSPPNIRVAEFVDGGDGKLSHLRIEQREGILADSDEKSGEKSGEKENATEAPWEPRDLDVDGVFVAIGQYLYYSRSTHSWAQSASR